MKRALIGKGAHAREVVQFLPFEVELFNDDEFLQVDTTQYEVMVAVGSSQLRKTIVKKLPRATRFFTYIHQTAILGSSVNIGIGSFIGPFCILTTNINVGSHALLLRSNQIGHDCNIGNFLSMMGGSIINGTCNIGDQFYLGTNSSVREKIKITNDVIVGLNSGIVKDITISGTYVGTPCKLI